MQEAIALPPVTAVLDNADYWMAASPDVGRLTYGLTKCGWLKDKRIVAAFAALSVPAEA